MIVEPMEEELGRHGHLIRKINELTEVVNILFDTRTMSKEDFTILYKDNPIAERLLR